MANVSCQPERNEVATTYGMSIEVKKIDFAVQVSILAHSQSEFSIQIRCSSFTNVVNVKCWPEKAIYLEGNVENTVDTNVIICFIKNMKYEY